MSQDNNTANAAKPTIKDEDQNILKYSQLLEQMYDDICEGRIKEEYIPQAVKVFDKAITTFDKLLDAEIDLTQKRLQWLKSESELLSTYRKTCDELKKSIKDKVL